MADFFEKKFRHLMPNWRSFENTLNLGELNGSKSTKLDSSFKPDISDLLEDWELHENIGVAGDILGTALVCNQESNQTVIEIASFVLKNKKLASKAMINAAKYIMNPPKGDFLLQANLKKPEFFNNESIVLEIYAKINELKEKLILNNYNPIYWIEIARYYSILGQNKKAERSVRNAIFLYPENRFILRSAARFFVHRGDLELAHDIVRKAELTKHDPWLLATEIALATFRNQNSRFANVGFRLLKFGDFHPFNISELASSIATLEMKNSNIKKSKSLFKQSLIHPNDNSLAQAEWASQEERRLAQIIPGQINTTNSFEALARDLSEQEKWDESIEFSKKWFDDLPFSRMPVLFGSEIAARKLKDHNQAVKLAKLGLLSHPYDPQLLNNIAYYLCLQNNIEEADKYLSKVKKETINSKDVHGICLTATRGLYYFRKGFHDKGRQLYIKAIEMAQEINNVYLNASAIVNYAREEILIGTEDTSELIPSLSKIAEYYEGKDISNDAKELIEKINKS